MKTTDPKNHIIVAAIRAAGSKTDAEIRVHLSRRFFERDPYQRALQLFNHYGMYRSARRNSVLIYVNLRRGKFALVGDQEAHAALGQYAWEQLARDLKREFISTHPERAIAEIVLKLGEKLAPHFAPSPELSPTRSK